MIRIVALLVVISGALLAGPAAAQFGSLFGNSPPPRPPADIPNGFPPQPPPVQYPGQSQYPGPTQPAYSPSAPSPSGIQAQPLPPPPGGYAAPAAAPGQGYPPRPLPSDRARAMPQPANPPPPQPADTTPQPDDTVVTETPTQHIENGRAVFAGLDKITGRTITFDAAIGETVQFGALQVTPRACYTRPPTEATNTDAFVEVDEVTLQGEIKRIFTGWMFASSPGLHAVEHPIYDVWLTDCAEPATGAVAQTTAQPGAAAAGTPPSTPSRPRQAPRQPVKLPAAAPAPDTDD
jgi:hypothetical protein